jgi:hypothetical protein
VQAYEWKQAGATLAPNNQSDGETYNRDASEGIHPTNHHQSSMVKGVPLIFPFTTSLETLVGLLIDFSVDVCTGEWSSTKVMQSHP